MVPRRHALVVAVACMLVLAGCTGADDAPTDDIADDVAEDVEDAPADDSTGGETFSTTAEAGDVDTDAYSDARQSLENRQLIRTGDLTLRVDSFEDADGEVRTVADDHDGFVSDTSQRTEERYDEEWTRGEFVIRVPSDRFDEAFDDLQEVGDVEAATTSSEDVSDQLVDLEARLENLRAERDRLRDLYEDANETEDVLAVQAELSSTQEEIERLEARQSELQEQVAFATITVEVAEEPPERDEPEEAAWYDTGVAAAFLESVDGVTTTVRAIVVGLAYAAPYLLAFGVPVVGVAYVAGRRLDLSL